MPHYSWRHGTLLNSLPSRSISRRSFLKAAAVGAGAAVALKSGLVTPAQTAHAANQELHRSWVWQFADDGQPERIRETLAYTGMAVILKTHDGEEFMRHYSSAPPAIGAPEDVRRQAAFFEEKGVPFHAWCVVEGLNPIREARICADVLSNGARSLTLDLEPGEGKNYWQAGTEEARAFGQELRRLKPNAYIIVAPDPRPWQLEAVPIREFAAISNEIAPQTYWTTFRTEGNRDMFASRGRFVDRGDMTPEWFLDQTRRDLRPFDRPIRPIGQGAAPPDEWRRFIGHAARLDMRACAVWRHGIATPGVFDAFRDARHGVVAPAPPPAPAPAAAVATAALPAPAPAAAAPAPPAQPAPPSAAATPPAAWKRSARWFLPGVRV